MSDYISREAMSETPKCPGCGADMELMQMHLCNPAFYYACAKCGWDSPIGIDSELAFRMAMRRTEPKNRVLTLEEVKNAEMDTFHNVMHWLELKQPEDSEIRYGVLGASMFLFDEKIDDDLDVIFTAAGMGEECRMKQKEYCKYWRCWLRKPTEAEMRETPWAGDSRE